MADNYFDQFDSEQGQTVAPGARPTLYERFKANMNAGTFEGTPEGALGLAVRKRVRDRQVENGLIVDPSIGRDLDAMRDYEQMPSWEGVKEGAAALAGQLVGGLVAPSSGGPLGFAKAFGWKSAATSIERPLLGFEQAASNLAARAGASAPAAEALGRTAGSGAFMSAFSTAVDPVTQAANVDAGIKEHYDPMQTAIAPLAGFALGSVIHGASEGARAFRDAAVYHAVRENLAKSDPGFEARPGPANTENSSARTAPLEDASHVGQAEPLRADVQQPQGRVPEAVAGNQGGVRADTAIGTTVPEARFGQQAGTESLSARVSQPKIAEDLGVEIPGTLLRELRGEPSAIIAHHGSPHDFDRFDMSKIGTGEGNQAFSYGLYFAQRDKVAKGYRDDIVKAMNHGEEAFVAGKPLDYENPSHQAAGALLDHEGNRQKAIAEFRDKIERWKDDANAEHEIGIWKKALHLLETGAKIPEANFGGHLYQVRIEANPDHFLDWDKPLSGQSKPVQDAIARLPGIDRALGLDTPSPLGGLIKRGLLPGTFDHTSPELSKALKEAGIPGIKYLDAGSRAAGEGSRNYVVFNDNLIRIIGKDGKPVPLNEYMKGQAEARFVEAVQAKAITPELRADLMPPAEAKTLPEQIVRSAMEGKAIVRRDFVTADTGIKTKAFVYNNRIVTVVDIDGTAVPFYISTGSGGKNSVKTGKWYPFFGNGPGDGWFNKGTEAEINAYYGSSKLKNAAEMLDAELGDLRAKKDDLPRGMNKGSGATDWVKQHYVDTTGMFDHLNPVDHKDSASAPFREFVKNIENAPPKEGAPPKTVGELESAIAKAANDTAPEGMQVKQSTLDAFNAAVRSVAAGTRDGGKPMSLTQFIAKNGGLALDGEAKARNLDKVFIPGGGPLARKSGKTIDGHWREALMEAGYLPKDAEGYMSRDITDELFNAIDRERAGNKVYSVHDAEDIPHTNGKPDGIAADVTEAEARIVAEHEAIGLKRADLDPQALHDAAIAIAKGHETDPTAAYERAVMELPQSDGGKSKMSADAGDLQFRRRTGAERTPAPEGAPPETGAVAARPELVSLQKQSLALANAIDLPLRQNRVQGGKDALGQYDRTQGVARVKEVPDFETVAHEGGHHLEARIEGLKDLIDTHAGELAPLDYDASLLRPSEGFAEFFAHYLINRGYAEREAPTFYNAFRQLLSERNPKLLKALDDAADAFTALRFAPAEEQVGASVFNREPDRLTNEVRKSLKKDGIAPTIMAMVGRMYMSIFDRHAPMTQYVRTMLKFATERNGGSLINLKAADNPEVLIRLLVRAQQGAEYQFRYGIIPYHHADSVGPSLHDAIAKATGQPSLLGNWDEEITQKFADYLAARRGLVLWDKVARNELLRDPVPFSRDTATRAIADLEAAHSGFAEGAAMLHEYSRNLLKKQLDGGLIERDLFDRLMKDEFYAPLFRNVDDEPLAGKTGGGASPQGPGMTQTIKRQTGSLRDIVNPIQGLMAQTFLVERTLRHNDVIKAMFGLADLAGNRAGRYIERIPAHEVSAEQYDLAQGIRKPVKDKGVDPDAAEAFLASLTDSFGEDPIMATMFKMQPARAKGEPIVFWKEGGQLQAARIINSKEGMALYELMTSLPRATQDVFSSLLGLSAQIQRSGITANPMFILTNYIRDQFAVSILRQGYVPIISGLRGFKSEITQDEAARLYSYFGGVSPGAAAGALHAAENFEVNAIGKKSFGQIRLGSGLKGLSEFMAISEAATRDTVFKQVFEQKVAEGLSRYEAGIEAAFQATDLLDFSRRGSRMEAAVKFIPFLNAHLQGLDKARRVMIEPLYRAAKGEIYTVADKEAVQNAYMALIKFSVVGASLGATYAAFMGDNPDYRDADPEMKAKHLIIPFGGKVYLIPKPFELTLGFNAGEEAVMRLVHDDPRAAARFATGAWDILKPPNPLTEQPLIRTTFETTLGRSMFTGRDIIPESLKGVDAWRQYTDRTSPIAKKIGEVTGWSPIKIDYAIGNLFGTNGRDILAASSVFEPDSPVQALEDRVFFRRLIKDPDRVSSATREWWTLAAQRTGTMGAAALTHQTLIDKGQAAQAAAYLGRQDSETKAFVTLTNAGDGEGKKAFSADAKRLNPFVRAQGAVSAASGVASELNSNRFYNTEDNSLINGLTNAQRRAAIDAVKHLAAMEQRNALIMTKQSGWENQPLMDTKKQMDIIKAVSPEVAAEVSRRYATNKVYTTQAVSNLWPRVKADLIRDGSQASLDGYVTDASSGGYEFGADRVKKRQKTRATVSGTAP